VPKTIDNDIEATAMTFGFDSAVAEVMDALDRLHTTATSHKRVMVVEVMGRHAGWIALHGGIAGGADIILIPEIPFDYDKIAAAIKQREAAGRLGSLVVVAEGARPKDGQQIKRDIEGGEFRLGGIGEVSRAKSPNEPEKKRAPACSDICSAAAHRRHLIAFLLHASESKPCSWQTKVTSGSWSATKIIKCDTFQSPMR